MMHAFDVDLPSYHGPLDLLLYLIRREELELEDISLARITHQYMDFIEVLADMDLDNISEFIEIVSVLIEMKAERVLPNGVNEGTELPDSNDSNSSHLMERLIQYKRFRDLACVLDEQSRVWQLRYRRLASEPIKRHIPPDEHPIARLEIWDLVSAFGRILKARQAPPSEAIRYDETPIHIYMQTIHARMLKTDRLELHELFEPGMHKSGLVGLFLATLEMTRYHGLEAIQTVSEGPLWLRKSESFPSELQVEDVHGLDSETLETSNLPIRPR